MDYSGYSLEHGNAYPAEPSYEGQYTPYPTIGSPLAPGFGPSLPLPSPPYHPPGLPSFGGYGQYAFPQPWGHPQPTHPGLPHQVALPPLLAAPQPPTADNNPPATKKRGRPPGSKNKDKSAPRPPAKQRGRPKGSLDSRRRTGYHFKDPEKEAKRQTRKPTVRQQVPSPPTSHADAVSSSHADDSDLALEHTSGPSAQTTPVTGAAASFPVAAPALTAGPSAPRGVRNDGYTGPGSGWDPITPPEETGAPALDPTDMFGYQDIDGNNALGIYGYGGMY